MKNKILIVLIIALAVIAFGYFLKTKRPVSDTPETITANFNCKDERSIQAVFHVGGDKSVDLVLSDGRVFYLPQTISASGARYANDIESLIFWNKGDTAFIEENGTITYQDCLVEKEN